MLPSPCCGNTCSCAIDARSHGPPRVWRWPSMLEEKGKYSCNNQRAPRGSQSFSPFSTSLSPPSLLARPPMFRFLVVLLAVVAALAGLAGAQVCGIRGWRGRRLRLACNCNHPHRGPPFPPRSGRTRRLWGDQAVAPAHCLREKDQRIACNKKANPPPSPPTHTHSPRPPPTATTRTARAPRPCPPTSAARRAGRTPTGGARRRRRCRASEGEIGGRLAPGLLGCIPDALDGRGRGAARPPGGVWGACLESLEA
jgi:hypothetical protein